MALPSAAAAAKISVWFIYSSRCFLAPTHPLALLSLADLYESLKKPELAIKIYDRVPANSPLHRNAAIQMAANLDTLDRAEEAQKHLGRLDQAASGRSRSHHGARAMSCAATRSSPNAPMSIPKALPPLQSPKKRTGSIFYFRGICYERSKQWPKAEADLKKALELFPDQPHVLNYLGYSWIDQGINLDEGMDDDQEGRAAASGRRLYRRLAGWAYYRVGNYEEATKQLERAIELKPEDPTINDHLGDAYWRVGRVAGSQIPVGACTRSQA